jgi:threonine dehydrogenase-like Zn-dependent dehydrogenase
MIRKLGRFVEFSVHREAVTVDWTIIGDVKELDIYGSHLGPYCYPLAIDYINRSLINVAPIVTHTLPLSEFQRGFEMVHDGRESIKVQLQP